MVGGEERTQAIEPQKRQADMLRRAVMKVGAHPAQKMLVGFDRYAPRIEEPSALRFDCLVAARYDAVEQNDLQQRHYANSDPAVQAGGVKSGFQHPGVGKELRDRNDAIIVRRAYRDINLEQRHFEVTFGHVGRVRRVSELGGNFAFKGLQQVRAGRKSLADEMPSGAVNDLPIGSPNLDGYDLPIQCGSLEGSIERAQRFLAQHGFSRQLLEIGPMEAVDVEGGCGSGIVNH